MDFEAKAMARAVAEMLAVPRRFDNVPRPFID